MNNEIRAPELRVVGEKGENLGVLPLPRALTLAKERGVDLVEIAPGATPPVARLISYDKYRYLREKAEKKERLAQKGGGLKQVQISVRAAENDLRVKIRQLEKFLAEGHPVEIRMQLRGREKGKKEWALQKMREFLAMVPQEINYKVTEEPKFFGMGISMQIMKR